MTRPGLITVEATEVDADAPIKVGVTTTTSTTFYYLTKDDAVRLANRLSDAVDELELAGAVSGE